MRKKLTILFAMLLSISAFAQNELVIEFTTDAYPEENAWVLYDLDHNIIEQNGELEKETTYFDTISLNESTCYYWTIYDEYGEGVNGPNPGDYKIYLDGNLFAECADPNFGDSVSVYNMGKVCTSNDAKVLNLSFLDHASKDLQPIAAEILNMGTDAITSLELSCSVNGVQQDVQKVEGLSIDVSESVTVAYPTEYNFDQVGDYVVTYSIHSVNGSTTSNIVNNNLSKTITVVDGYLKMNIIEDIMSYECGPCWDADVQMKATLSEFKGTQIFLKYMSWSFADTKYFEEIEELSDLYRVRSVPHIRLNGEEISWLSFSPTYYRDSIGIATPLKITSSATIEGDSMYISAKVISNEAINSESVLRGIVIEKECFDVSLSYDNRLAFENVAYGFVEDLNTFIIDNINANEELSFNTTIDISGYRFEEGSFEDMGVVFYLQDITSQYIYQTGVADAEFKALPLDLAYNIEDNATEVDTAGLIIEVTSNRKLYDSEGKKIVTIKDHVTLRQDGPSGVKVPFIVEYTDQSIISVVPEYGWTKNTTYYLLLENFSTINGEQMEQDELTFTIKDFSTGVNEQEHLVNIYPNPVSNVFFVEGIDIKDISIYNISGTNVLNVSNPKSTNQINVEGLSTGIYFVKVETAFGIEIRKIVK